jgi:CHAT domain-containing protein/tetratricopeptide (TPR) repeat protein
MADLANPRPATLDPLLEELDSPGTVEVIPRRIAVCRRVLRLLPAEPPTSQRAAVLVLLGDLLTAASGGSGRRVDEALAAYDQAVAALEALRLNQDRGRTFVKIADLWLTRSDGLRTLNVERAARACQEALSLLTPDLDLEAWASARLDLAIACKRRAGEDRAAGQERALVLLLSLQTTLAVSELTDLRGKVFNNLAGLYMERLQGDREDNLEQAILWGEQALSVRPREADPFAWAKTVHNLALAWTGRFRGDRAENLETALSLFHAALEVRTREAVPWDWASSMDALGNTFASRIRGSRMENLEAALACHEQALTIYRRRLAPDAWIDTQINRALTYLERLAGDRTANVERSIRISRQVLAELDRDQRPVDWALAVSNLGWALQDRLLGNQSENLEEAIHQLDAALEVLRRDDFSQDWARSLNHLGNAYAHRVRGDRTENLERAIALYEEALEVRRQDVLPWEWAETTHNLAIARFQRRQGKRVEEIETALSLAETCLAVYTRDAAPRLWAATLNSRGSCYLERLAGIQEENVDRAIADFEQSLAVRTREADPFAWAYTLSKLGKAYWLRVAGDREDNLERAITLFSRALDVRTRRQAPFAWAETQNNLGLAWAARRRGERRENRRQAARAYRRALTVYPLDVLPDQHRRVCRNLGNLLFDAKRWRNATAAYAGALSAGELLYAEGATPQARSVELWEHMGTPMRTAYALAKQGRRAEAVRTLEASRARQIRERLERDAAALLRAPEPERSELLACRRRLDNLEALSRKPDGLSAREYLGLSAELREARSTLQTLRERLRQAAPDLVFRDSPDLPAGLPHPVVYLLTTTHGTLALILHPGARGDEGIEALFLNGLREDRLTAILQGGPGRASFLITALEERDDSLAAVLSGFWEEIRSAVTLPLARRLRASGCERALLVPCGPLGLLPLPALAIDEMELAFAPSARIPLELAARRRPTDPVLAAVGNPLSTAGPLPLAALEAETSAEPFPAGSRRLLLGQAADRAAVLAALPGATHLHFACHGVFVLAAPLESALLLAGQDCLTVRDLLDGGLDLSAARLVVLSACQTAMSDQEVPDELLGFPAAFLQAGVPAVLGTLWRVGDVATSLLLTDFYRRHVGEGEDPVQALRGAQLRLRDGTLRDLGLIELLERAFEESGQRDRKILAQLTRYRRKSGDSRPFAAPRHWAGFVVWGE